MFQSVIKGLKNQRFSFDLVKESLGIFSVKILGIFASYLFSFLVARHYGADGWGVFSLAMACTTIGVLFGKFGFDTALLRYAAQLKATNREEEIWAIYREGLKIVIPLCVIITAALYVGAEPLATQLFKKPHLFIYIRYMSFAVLPFVLSIINSEGLRGVGLTSKYAIIQNLSVFALGSILIFIYSGFDFSGELWLYKSFIASVYISCFLSFYWLSNAFIINSKKKRIGLKEIVRVSLPMFWSNAMFVVMIWTDTLMLGVFSTEADIGVYNVAAKISNIITLPLLVINGIVAPKFAASHEKKDFTNLNKLVNESTKTIFLLTLPIYVIIIALPGKFMNLFGSEFQNGTAALMILITAQFIKAFCGSTDFILQMTDNEKLFQNIIVGAMIINVAANFVLIPLYGIMGAAISNLLSILFWNVTSLIYIKKRLNIFAIYWPTNKN